jgi:hypothetical protein
MSEQQEKAKSFMLELDEWTEAAILMPLFDEAREYDDKHTIGWAKAVEQVKKAVRTKVLESYRNGQQAGPRTAKQPQKGSR